MSTYLLAWNPDRWHWADLHNVIERVDIGEPVIKRWSCGSTRRIVRGDRVFLMRLGREPRGVFGSGTVVVEPYEDIHWDPEKADLGKIALFIQFQIDGLLDPEHEPILWRERLKSEAPFSRMHWDTQMSGIRIPDEVANELEKVWYELVDLVDYSLPEEVVISQSLVEGVAKRISVNAYERNQTARKLCIEPIVLFAISR
jgi:5-methylcytosine-specific restriction protein A